MKTLWVTNEAELRQCLHIRREVFVEEQRVPEELETDEWDSPDAACTHILLLDEGGEPVGTARFRAYDEQTAKMQRVAVKRRYRGRGYGRLLMDALERGARELGFAYAILDAQTHAQPFYEKLGYRVVSERPFFEAGIPHVRMKKRLAP